MPGLAQARAFRYKKDRPRKKQKEKKEKQTKELGGRHLRAARGLKQSDSGTETIDQQQEGRRRIPRGCHQRNELAERAHLAE